MSKSAAPFAGFEPEYESQLKQIFEERIVFNRVMGLKVLTLDADRVTGRLEMKPELIGHYQHNRVHGGVVSACLDALGGLAVCAAVGARHMDEPVPQRLQRFSKLGTIDLRIDYLRPVIGEFFLLSAEVLRIGSRVGTTRMELRGADGKLLSAGAAAYIVS